MRQAVNYAKKSLSLSASFLRALLLLLILFVHLYTSAQTDPRRFFGITVKTFDENNATDAIQQENILKCFFANNITITENNTDEFYKAIAPFLERVLRDDVFVKRFCEQFAEKSIAGNIWTGDCLQFLSNGSNIQNDKNAEKLKGLLRGYNDGLYTSAKHLLQARILYIEQLESYSQFDKTKAELFINPPENLTIEDVIKFYDNIPRHELQRKLKGEVTNIFQYLQRRNKDDLFKIDETVKFNLQKNGWTESQIKNTYNNPAFKVRTISTTVSQNITSYYFNPDCSYIIVNTLFQNITEISNKADGNSKPTHLNLISVLLKRPSKTCGQDESKGTDIYAQSCLTKADDENDLVADLIFALNSIKENQNLNITEVFTDVTFLVVTSQIMIRAPGAPFITFNLLKEKITRDFALKFIKAVGTSITRKVISYFVKLKPLGKGSTGRTKAKDLLEEMAMQEILDNPTKGKIIEDLEPLSDFRWQGWRKVRFSKESNTGNKVEIHFNALYDKNGKMIAVDDFKFVSGG